MFAQSFQTANIFSGPDLLIVLGIVVLLFGGKKIPEIAKGFGEGIKNFKQAVKEDQPAARKEEEEEVKKQA